MTLRLLVLCLPVALAACLSDGLGEGRVDAGPDAATTCTSHASQASCEADARCEVASCPTCGGASFLACYDKGSQHGALCPAVNCGQPCETYTTEAACDADATCVSLYVDIDTVGCADIACVGFSRCTSEVVSCLPSPLICTDKPTVVCPSGYQYALDGTSCSSACARTGQCFMPKD